MKVNKINIIKNRVISLLQIVVAVPNMIFYGVGGIGAFSDKDIDFGFGDLLFIKRK